METGKLEYEAMPMHFRNVFWTDLEAAVTRSREMSRLGLAGSRGRTYSAPFEGGDVLLEIEPAVYVEKLTGVEVPRHGMIVCPFPDHEDFHPSVKVYPDAERGFTCFGCGKAGSIYDFAAALWGMGTRGPDFIELRHRLARELLS